MQQVRKYPHRNVFLITEQLIFEGSHLPSLSDLSQLFPFNKNQEYLSYSPDSTVQSPVIYSPPKQ